MTKQEQSLDQLAQEVLRLFRNTLLVNLRFLDAAVSQFAMGALRWNRTTGRIGRMELRK